MHKPKPATWPVCFGAWLLASLLCAGGCDDKPKPRSTERQEVGAGCRSDEDCVSGYCLNVGKGTRVCTASCASSAECPNASNWWCGAPNEIKDEVCLCRATTEPDPCVPGLDWDCDGQANRCVAPPPDDESEQIPPPRDAGSSSALDAAAVLDGTAPNLSDASADGGDGASSADGASNPDEPDAAAAGCSKSKVDLLFVIDNSGSMSEEQVKLASSVPQLLAILATGNRNGMRSAAGAPTDFGTAESIHVGVVSTDMGVSAAPAQNSCGERSFAATDRDPSSSTIRLDKPYGDDGALLNSTAVAVAGIWVRQPGTSEVRLVVPPEPSCASVVPDKRYLASSPAVPFEDTGAAFSCVSKLGRNGCGLEQQLDAMLKALTPAESTRFTFSRNTHGQGTAPGLNAGFLRPDALLAVIVVSDEEDCSIPDSSSALFDATDTRVAGEINVRCGLSENQRLLHAVSRYTEGLRALKPEPYRSRVIFGGIVGVPLAADLGGEVVHTGQSVLTSLLARSDMQFKTRRNAANTGDEPVPTCTSVRGDGTAAPGRRFVELASSLGDNGVITSICEDSFQPFIVSLGERIAARLSRCE